MYQVFYNQFPLYDPRDDELILHDPEVHLAVGEAGEMSFTIYPEHPYASQLVRTKGIVELRADGQPVFKGRIRKDTRGFHLSREIEVEGLLACLNDSIIPPFVFPDDFLGDANYQAAAASGNVVQFFMGWLLEQHNAQVGSAQKIQLGTVTVSDPNNYLRRASSEYLTTMEVVRKKVADLLGGYLVVDYSGAVTVLNYYDDLPLTNVQEVDFGQNLLDLEVVLDGAETCTAILPVGAEGLTLESLSDGEISPGIWKQGKILYSKEAEEALGGRITRTMEWEDVTQASNLRNKASAWLVGDGVKTVQIITVKAADLGAIEDLPSFTVGRYVKLNSAPHGFAEVYPLMELEPDILDPGNTVITMGSTAKAATDIAHANQSAVKNKQDQFQLVLDKQLEGIATTLPISVQTQITSALQTAESIVFTALDQYVETANFETFRRTVENQFSILADELVLRFTEAVEQTQEVDRDLQQTLETLTKYFSFTQNGLTIRAGENAMNLTLDNDLVIFKKAGQQFGWWDGVDFHTGNIVIGVTERAQFGSFAFVPRSNGSLSFLEVGE